MSGDVHEIDLLLTLAGGLSAALLLGLVTRRLGLSPIVGYLLAGIVVGPSTPGFVADEEFASQLAEVGVVLLMFGVGLQFHLEDLLAVRRLAVPGALAQITAATGLGLVLGAVLGWPLARGLVFGVALSVASTVVLLRVLSDANDLHTPAGHAAVGWLVVEDLFTVLVLVLLPVVGSGEGGVGEVAIAVGGAAVKASVLLALMLIVGRRLIPWILARVAETGARELFTLTVLVVALGIAVGAAVGFGVSMALGAFLAGMVVGRSDFSLRAATEALPMRDAFAVLFFVSVGMLLEPSVVTEAPCLVTGALVIVLVGKPLAALALVVALGHPLRTAVAIAVALAQVGEFSFMLAELGLDLGLLDRPVRDALVVAAIVSIAANPLAYRMVDALGVVARTRPAFGRWWTRGLGPELLPPDDPGAEDEHRAVVVGYGPIGRTLVRLLAESGVRSTVIELDRERLRLARQEGVRAVYGDATHVATLEEAGVRGSIALVLAPSELHGAAETVRHARAIDPSVPVVARTSYLRDVPDLRSAGADLVCTSEAEVGLALVEGILRRLGATPEQIDRERERARRELGEAAATT